MRRGRRCDARSRRRSTNSVTAPEGIGETTPGTSALKRLEQARAEVVDACDGFLRRAAIEASLTKDERREILKGMCLTRSVDNRLKQFFMGGEVRWGDMAFQGKGFRSLGQEAIYAGAIRLKRGAAYKNADGTWNGDVMAPVIRDLGMTLAMRHDEEAVAMILRAQMGKAGPPMSGKDLHTGDFAWGVLPAAAPLAVGSLSMAGMAMAFSIQKSERVALSFIGEGGSSLGEWHEAINACAAAKLPAIFCLQNNQTALSTPVRDNSAARVFADKAAGYGIPGLTIDGTDPDEVAAAFTWAAERARAGEGPTLIEVVAMRMCGHAHHDDMLYLGKDQPPSWDYHQLHDTGYANRELYEFWAKRDPIPMYARRLEDEGVINAGASRRVEEVGRRARRSRRAARDQRGVAEARAGRHRRVQGRSAARARRSARAGARLAQPASTDLPPLEAGPPFDKKGNTFLEAVMLGVGDALKADPRVFVYGEDVGGQYGNAFLLLQAAAQGLRRSHPQLAARRRRRARRLRRRRAGGPAADRRDAVQRFRRDRLQSARQQRREDPLSLGRRGADGGAHAVGRPASCRPVSQPEHRAVVLSHARPEDRRAVDAGRRARVDGRGRRRSRSGPVLRAHRALSRSAHQAGACRADAPSPLPIGKAALRRAGSDIAMISYGAYVHHCMRVAEKLAAEGIEAAVLDLRSLSPLDKDAILAVTRHCNRVLIVHEDSRTGGIGESLAAIIQEEAFESLDAPIRILGALDAPVPYSPPLEEFFLVNEEDILQSARLLSQY